MGPPHNGGGRAWKLTPLGSGLEQLVVRDLVELARAVDDLTIGAVRVPAAVAHRAVLARCKHPRFGWVAVAKHFFGCSFGPFNGHETRRHGDLRPPRSFLLPA